jgi:hypothetical protein
MNPMNALLLVLKLFPLVWSIVRAVEDAIPLPGQGKKKLDLVLDTLKTAYEGSNSLASEFSWDKLLAIVVPMVGKIVDLHNELGLFQKSAQPKTA